MVILNIELNNINLDNNFDEDYPNTIILIRLFLDGGMVGLVHVKRREKRNRSDVYWRVVKVCVSNI